MTDLERIIDVVGLLAPHRQRMLLQTAVTLLELQFDLDGVAGMDELSPSAQRGYCIGGDIYRPVDASPGRRVPTAPAVR